MGIDPVSLAVGGLILGGLSAGASAIQQRKSRKSAEAQFDQQEARTASQLEKARKAETQAGIDAEKKAETRRLAIESGGRPSTFAASAFGLRQPANIRKKTLG